MVHVVFTYLSDSKQSQTSALELLSVLIKDPYVKEYTVSTSRKVSFPEMLTVSKIEASEHMLDHGTVIQTRIKCEKIPCYMRKSACRWRIIKKV